MRKRYIVQVCDNGYTTDSKRFTWDVVDTQRLFVVANFDTRIAARAEAKARNEALINILNDRESRAALPPCVQSMGCYCAGHARGNDAREACDTRETCELCDLGVCPDHAEGNL